MNKATLKGVAIILTFLAVALPVEAATLGSSGIAIRHIERLDAAPAGRVIRVQSGSGQLVSPSVAARNARRTAPGSKVLDVKLKRGVYVVKIKNRGQVRRVKVDARSGRVVGY